MQIQTPVVQAFRVDFESFLTNEPASYIVDATSEFHATCLTMENLALTDDIENWAIVAISVVPESSLPF